MEATVPYLLMLKVYQFKAKDSEIKKYAPCLGNISNEFTIDNMTRTRLKGVVKFFSVDFNPIDINDILDIHKYLVKITWYKIMFGLIEKMFFSLLNGSVKE